MFALRETRTIEVVEVVEDQEIKDGTLVETLLVESSGFLSQADCSKEYWGFLVPALREGTCKIILPETAFKAFQRWAADKTADEKA